LSFDEVGMAQFDTAASLLDYLVDQGKIASSGARVTWLDGKQYYKKVLAEKIKSEGLEKELIALLAS
jgi:hypothetical protein